MTAPAEALAVVPVNATARRVAVAAMLVSLAVFVAVAPFATTPLTPVPGFILVYQTVLVVNDVITAVMLFGQFRVLEGRAILILACGYLFSALMAITHALSFPGLFASGGLLGAGPQTTAWLYYMWHGGFPLFVIAYALRKNADERHLPAAAGRSLRAALAATIVLAAALAWLATAGHDALPAIMQGNRYAPAKWAVAGVTWSLSLLALGVLWRRRPHSLLDLWLMVTLVAWLSDIALAAVLNAGRFDVGFYAGRVYGLLASSFVLIVLLMESTLLHVRLVEAHRREQRDNQLLQLKTEELTVVNEELDAFSYTVSHDLHAPLRAVDAYAQMLQEDHADKFDAEARRLLAIIRASTLQMARQIEALLSFARLGRQPVRMTSVALSPLVREIVAELGAANAGRSIRFEVGDLGSVQGDPALLKHVFGNLLANAVKFTRHRDPAIISVEADTASERGALRRFSVKDNGAGFEMAYYAKLFGVFQRLHSNAEFPGTGVGLAIVNRIVTRHGGSVWATAKVDEGATFYLTLKDDATPSS